MRELAVGIDLGTSNCAMALAMPDSVLDAEIPQISGPGRVDEKKTFASALYIPFERQFAPGSLRLPWSRGDEPYLQGNYAREIGAGNPDRLVTSAKSWLCQGTVSPTEPVLPWASVSVTSKLSPYEASRSLLEHLRHAYSHQCKGPGFPGNLDGVQVVVTVPASFDEAARKLTAQAAIEAGWGEHTVLLEEPQAAFYAWLQGVRSEWRTRVKPGELVLVCDVGGGTTDFSLISVGEREGNLELERVSVGKHVLLGGDNMDLALAYSLMRKLDAGSEPFGDSRFTALVHASRRAKETLYEKEKIGKLPVTVASAGSDLFSGTLETELTRGLLDEVVRDGFFPLTPVDELPSEGRGAGLHEYGLSYETDPAVSRHLAKFLTASMSIIKMNGVPAAHRDPSRFDLPWVHPDAVVFNGGVFKAAQLRQRVLELLGSWTPGRPVRELAGADPDLAVARGAAIYGHIKQTGRGVRIRAGVSRSYYIGLVPSIPAVPGIRPPIKAVCVAEQGMEEGDEHILEDRIFGLGAGKTATFRFFSSPERAGDRVGQIVPNAEEQLEESTSLEMNIPAEKGQDPGYIIPVKLHSMLSELGMLRLWMQHTLTGQKWELTFNVRTG